MITFGQLVEYAKKRDANAGTVFSDEIYRIMVDSAVREVWNAREWPFHLAESSISTVAPYTTGTVAVNNASTTVTLTTGTWSTSWPTPARIWIEGEASDYLISSFDSTSTATLDKAFAGSNGTGLTYELSFPAYDLPSDFMGMERPTSGWWWGQLRPVTYDEWLELRIDGVFSGQTDRYAIVQGDGIVNPKMYLYPAPETAELVRFPYMRACPTGRLYATGTATATNASTAVTGQSTAWQKLGYSIADQVLEFPNTARDIFGTFTGAAASDTSATLSANWGGATQTAQAYRISSQIRMPDQLKPALLQAIEVKVAEEKRDYMGANYFKNGLATELNRAANAMSPVRSTFCKKEATVGESSIEFPTPRLLTDANGGSHLLRY